MKTLAEIVKLQEIARRIEDVKEEINDTDIEISARYPSKLSTADYPAKDRFQCERLHEAHFCLHTAVENIRVAQSLLRVFEKAQK